MTTLASPTGAPLAFEVPDELIATAPIESTGRRRDQARLLVASRSDETLVDTVFADLPRFLRPGDVLVVNTSATLPAAVPSGEGLVLHLSTELPGGLWLVELRRPCGAGSRPFLEGQPGAAVALAGGGRAELLVPFPAGTAASATRAGVRLWLATLRFPTPVPAYLAE
ncbi:MAG: S-adenosylmethionine:tRNA ribosyltransferase-isomerase [Acidimicrobiales bacterium]